MTITLRHKISLIYQIDPKITFESTVFCRFDFYKY
jgi:hypothetical protein